MKTNHVPALHRDAIRYWNEPLSSWPEPETVIGCLLRSQKDRGLTIGEKPFCPVARPRFVTTGEMNRELLEFI